jgi:hypothetical protein
MNYVKRQLVFYIVYLIAGVLLLAAALVWSPENIRTGAVTGIVSGFIFTGAGGVFMNLRLIKNPAKAEREEILKTEERTVFISTKIQSSVQTVITIIMSGVTMIALIAGERGIALAFAGILAAEAVLFIIFGSYYGKKY